MPEKTKPADQPASPSKRDAAKPTHGRRAADGDDEPALGGDMESPKKAFNETSADAGGVEDVQTIGRDDATGPAAPDQIAMTEEAVEELQQEVAPAPVDYHTTMPKIADLEAAGPGGAKWAPAMQAQTAAGSSGEEGGDIDLTVLTGVLCAELDDEDEPWVPEVMLVQLTSELIDAQTADVEDVEEDGVQLDASTDPGNRATSTAVVGGTASGTNPTTSAGSAGPSPTSSQPNISAAGRRRGNY